LQHDCARVEVEVSSSSARSFKWPCDSCVGAIFLGGRKTRTTAVFFRVSTKAVRALGPSNSRTARWPAFFFYGTPAASRRNPQSRSFLVGSARCFTSRDLLYLLRVSRTALRVFWVLKAACILGAENPQRGAVWTWRKKSKNTKVG
jgi:hypothetical protein